jgi:hypothetical protein
MSAIGVRRPRFEGIAALRMVLGSPVDKPGVWADFRDPRGRVEYWARSERVAHQLINPQAPPPIREDDHGRALGV